MSVKTTCAYCGVGCGVLAATKGERSATIKGDPAHPANYGKLCSKGTHLGETIGLDGRLLTPEIRGRQAGWDEALDLIAAKFSQTIADYGPDSVGFYVSGQLLTEDYYVANKLMKGFIGSGNIDTNSRLCMSSAVAAHMRAFGEDVVPCSYEDLDAADLIILVGSNTAWCHPVIWQRIEAARAARGTRLVVIDPRRTETAEGADLHLAIAPDTDIALFNDLLNEMRSRWMLDGRYLAAHVEVPAGFWDMPKLDVAKVCDIAPADLEAFYDLFTAHPRTVTLFSQGANQSTQGTDKGNAIINVHLATGRIGKPGTGPVSITGQPNAMGGREVGGMANLLSAHRDLADPAHRAEVARLWGVDDVPARPGKTAVEMFQAAADGEIRALWIACTNPAQSLPDQATVRRALQRAEFVVLQEAYAGTATARHAHLLLPASSWGEKEGTVTNSERRISRVR
ncbi:MAG: molybdopterin-dependent oxidoreductase, partial [Alphaproteobacteria bacterium]|nr:molybdopterin-dependent oxidoreductase [Alphaproteobacteria bacterium]